VCKILTVRLKNQPYKIYASNFFIDFMPVLACRDYGFECDFVAKGDDVTSVIEAYGEHSASEHGIEYSKEALMQFILRKT
jgi:predicted small metal-binding protein